VRNFIRKKEDFVCKNCGKETAGDGYTDHCPECLWGRHVDDNLPGDRASKCRGMMEPVRAIYQKGKFRIYYVCQKCRHEFGVREGAGDNRDKLLELAGRV